MRARTQSTPAVPCTGVRDSDMLSALACWLRESRAHDPDLGTLQTAGVLPTRNLLLLRLRRVSHKELRDHPCRHRVAPWIGNHMARKKQGCQRVC